SASASMLTCAVCWNSAPDSGLLRISASFTTPTETASFGTSPIASVFANASGAMTASAAKRNSFFMSELLSSEQPGRQNETDDTEGAGGENGRPGEWLREPLRGLRARNERHHRPAQLRGLGHDPVQRVDHEGLPFLRHRGRHPLVVGQHHAEEE